MAVLVTGGARSGKSRFAEAFAARCGKEGLYIATLQIFDEEMRVRVERHRARRINASIATGSALSTDTVSRLDISEGSAWGFAWTTIEEPYELCRVLSKSNGSVVLVDCLTLWLTNWMLEYERNEDTEAKVMAKVEELADVIARHTGQVILVTNEVGDSVVPEYPLGRQFRDYAGWMNQRIAAVCDQVFLVTAGIPVELKSLAYRLPDEDGMR